MTSGGVSRQRVGGDTCECSKIELVGNESVGTASEVLEYGRNEDLWMKGVFIAGGISVIIHVSSFPFHACICKLHKYV